MGVMAEIQHDAILSRLGTDDPVIPPYIEWTVDTVEGFLEGAENFRIRLPVQQALETVYEYAIAVMGETVSLINVVTMMTYFDMGVIESNMETALDPFWSFALDRLGFRYNEIDGTFTMISTGLIGEMHTRQAVMKEEVSTLINTQLPKLETRMDDLENSLGDLTPEVLEKIEIVAENIDEILEFMENGVEYLIGEVQAGVLTLVKGYVDPQIDIIANGLDDLWYEVSRYGNVFIDVILSLINILLTDVQIPADQIEYIMVSINAWITEEVTKQTASLQAEINVLYNEVYLMSDVWIEALKKKLVI